MRVLIAHNRYRLPGGEERHVGLLDEGLSAAGVEVRRFERQSTELDGARLKRLGTALTLTYRPGGGGISRVIEEWQPDVVHFHNIWPQLTPAALRVARRSGAAVVLTAHNYRFACPGGTLLRDGEIHEDCIDGSSLACALRNPRGKLGESFAYGIALEAQRRMDLLNRWVDAFVAPSAFMAAMLVRAGARESRVHVIHYGVLAAETPSLPGTSALFAGRLADEKGVRTLLEAARLAPEVSVVFAGGGPLDAVVRSAPVAYLGHLRQAALRDALRDAAYAVVPSEWYDNLPFAALESLAAGRPVIATRIGGLPEIIEDGVSGLLVPPRSAPALAEAMRRLSASPDLTRELGANALERARKEFSLARQVEKTTALYDSLLARNGSRSRG